MLKATCDGNADNVLNNCAITQKTMKRKVYSICIIEFFWRFPPSISRWKKEISRQDFKLADSLNVARWKNTNGKLQARASQPWNENSGIKQENMLMPLFLRALISVASSFRNPFTFWYSREGETFWRVKGGGSSTIVNSLFMCFPPLTYIKLTSFTDNWDGVSE